MVFFLFSFVPFYFFSPFLLALPCLWGITIVVCFPPLLFLFLSFFSLSSRKGRWLYLLGGLMLQSICVCVFRCIEAFSTRYRVVGLF